MSVYGPYEFPKYYIGLSTDTKPTLNVRPGDEFFESDTRIRYIYSGSAWGIKAGSSSGMDVYKTVTDPATNAAVSTTIIDGYDGVLITLTTTGNSQTLQTPTFPTAGKKFTVTNNNTSTNTIAVIANSITYTLAAGKAQTFGWEGTVWIPIDVGITAIPVTVPQGGSGVATLTDHGVLLGSGTDAFTAMTPLGVGELLVGVASADPTAIVANATATKKFLTETSSVAGFNEIVSSDLITPLTTPPAIGGTTPAAGAFTTVTAPNVYGSAAENGDITIEGTSHVTKTTSYVALQPTAGKVGIGISAPTEKLHIAGGAEAVTLILTNTATGHTVNDGVRFSLRDDGSGIDVVVKDGYFNLEVGSENRLKVDVSGNVFLGGKTAAGTSAAKVLVMGSGTAPTTPIADAVQMLPQDDNAIADTTTLYMRDELGNVGAIGFKKNIVDSTAGSLDLSSAAHKIADYIHEISSAGTVTLPAVAAALYGSRVIVMVTAAVAVSIDPNASDRIVLSGTALVDGNKITNDSSAGSFVELYCDGVNGWRTLSIGGNWIDGGA
jgi:hypothetical protein